MEFDISGTSISYDTGDHVAVWPVNADREVDLFLEMFQLKSKRDLVVEIAPSEISTKMSVPCKTTYETLVRYHLDIGAPLTRHTLRRLSLYATADDLGSKLLHLADNKTEFDKEVLQRQLTIAQLLSNLNDTSIAQGALDIPFSLVIELLPKLRPRHYSISSSSLTSRKAISITAVVDRREDSSNQISFQGVSTGYLSALTTCHSPHDSSSTSHTLLTRRQKAQGLTVPTPLIHVRRSKFRPPFDPSTPIIMIGPGTGVAPFRAFVQERAYQYQQGRTVGRTILFFGCRDPAEDFIYKEEWDDILENQRLGDGAFRMYTAFSRQSGQKRCYVQDLIIEPQQRTEICELVLTKNAHVYVCGNAARMAKDVARAMEFVLAGSSDGEKAIPQLKKEGRWCEDVW